MLEADQQAVEADLPVVMPGDADEGRSAADEASERPEEGSEQKAEPEKAVEEPEKEPPKAVPDWMQRRLDQISHARAQAEERAAAAEAEARRYREAAGEQESDETRQPTREQYLRDVQAAAQQAAATERFNAECNTIFDKGKEAFPDWEGALGNFKLVGGLPPLLIEMASETGEAHRVLYELGKNPEEADRIMRLSPARAAIAIAKMASTPAKPPAISKAPDPVRPLRSGASGVEKDPKDMSIQEWVAWRNKGAAA